MLARKEKQGYIKKSLKKHQINVLKFKGGLYD